jgi:excisionase family DNA binding protein
VDQVAHRYLTVARFADATDLSRDTVRRWIREGRIKGKAIGGRRAGYRIPYDELERVMEPEVATGS